MRPIVDQIAAQLRARPTCWVIWGENPQRVRLAQEAATIIADEAGWPRVLYVPDNPLEMMLFAPLGDGEEGLVVGEQLDRLAPDAFDRLLRARPGLRPDAVFGDLVDECLRVSDELATRESRSTTTRGAGHVDF